MLEGTRIVERIVGADAQALSAALSSAVESTQISKLSLPGTPSDDVKTISIDDRLKCLVKSHPLMVFIKGKFNLN